jgi:hypothetical protein
MCLIWRILGESGKSCQEIAVCEFSLHYICWVDTIEDQGLTALVLEMVRGPPPIEALASFIFPVSVTLVLLAIYEESLGSVRESWIVPRSILLNDLFPW